MSHRKQVPLDRLKLSKLENAIRKIYQRRKEAGKAIVCSEGPLSLERGVAFICLGYDNYDNDVCVIIDVRNDKGYIIFVIAYYDKQKLTGRAFRIRSWRLMREIYDGDLIERALADPRETIESQLRKLYSKGYDLIEMPISPKRVMEYVMRLIGAHPASLYKEPTLSKWAFKALIDLMPSGNR